MYVGMVASWFLRIFERVQRPRKATFTWTSLSLSRWWVQLLSRVLCTQPIREALHRRVALKDSQMRSPWEPIPLMRFQTGMMCGPWKLKLPSYGSAQPMKSLKNLCPFVSSGAENTSRLRSCQFLTKSWSCRILCVRSWKNICDFSGSSWNIMNSIKIGVSLPLHFTSSWIAMKT